MNEMNVIGQPLDNKCEAGKMKNKEWYLSGIKRFLQ